MTVLSGERLQKSLAPTLGETLSREPQHLCRCGHGRKARGECQPHPCLIRERLSKHDLLTPGTAIFDEYGRDHDRPQRSTAPLSPREQAIDQQPETTVELKPGGRLRQLELLAQELAGRPRTKSSVATPGKLVGEQTGAPEAISQRAWWHRDQLTQRPDPQPFECFWHVGKRWTRAKKRDRQRREVGASLVDERVNHRVELRV